MRAFPPPDHLDSCDVFVRADELRGHWHSVDRYTCGTLSEASIRLHGDALFQEGRVWNIVGQVVSGLAEELLEESMSGSKLGMLLKAFLTI